MEQLSTTSPSITDSYKGCKPHEGHKGHKGQKNSLLKIESLSTTFHIPGTRITALKDFSCTIEAGEFVTLVGHSGCGKSTLLKTIMGLQQPDSGCIGFSGMEGRSAMVFQEPRLLSAKTVEKNLRLALKHRKSRAGADEVINRTLSMLGLSPFRQAYPSQLSGGMAQRVALGRALCREPELLLMDEPFASLDALTRGCLQEELSEIHRKSGATVLFVTHDIREALILGSRLLIMASGCLIQDLAVDLPFPRNPSSRDFNHLYDTVITSLHASQQNRKNPEENPDISIIQSPSGVPHV